MAQPPASEAAPGKTTGTVKNPLPARQGRDALNRILMNIYRPYLTQFPETKFVDILTTRYGVGETRLMTVDQMEDLINWMEGNLGRVIGHAPGTIPATSGASNDVRKALPGPGKLSPENGPKHERTAIEAELLKLCGQAKISMKKLETNLTTQFGHGSADCTDAQLEQTIAGIKKLLSAKGSKK